MFDVKDIIAQAIHKQLPKLSRDQIYDMLEYPPNPEMGDIALPCFKLSKTLRKPPVQIAQELASNISNMEFIDKVEPVSGYLNFFFNKSLFVEQTLKHILEEQERYGSQPIGEGKTIVIDYSAPNIAKPFHVGHLRSTVIGNSLRKIFEFMGYRCIGVNHLGDWGTQFGKLIVAYKLWGNKEEVEAHGIKELMRLYVKFHEEAEKDPKLEDEARSWFARMEKGDNEALELWQWFKDISLKEFQKVYDLLDVHFDSYAGESFYNDKMDAVIEELRQKNLLKESEGAMIVDLEEYGMPPCMILKKDGSSLYATRDIAAAIYRKKEYDFHKCIYVTGAAQSLHFQQWFKVIELMGYEWAKDLIHVPFGLVSLGGEKLSTRKGKVVLLEDILSEAIKKTLEIIESKNPDLENKEEVARYMGVGAVIFSDLYSNRIKDVSFSWDEVLNFDGETGPYVQYTHARCCSVIRKAYEQDSSFNPGLLQTKEEYQLCKTLYQFPEKVMMALTQLEPSIITRYLVDLAQNFNRFYHEHPILADDQQLRAARLALVKATRITLANGLKLIGLKPLERV
ncbi:arginine--tRNA ligase [Caldicoprobacter algeriensis]|uniref:arginine--tRNA ligase n=1 Tax=Caldicoprobacter algeriensis TaxID=699281 RepID=UPI00207AA0D7|nr:arginine--tRNA ligase [Caldicoprobacter algeriensis]MCM8901640.1 arginine--tRNA ligase [Caldicoprobacter algeriensis]